MFFFVQRKAGFGKGKKNRFHLATAARPFGARQGCNPSCRLGEVASTLKIVHTLLRKVIKLSSRVVMLG